MTSNTTGAANTALGVQSLEDNTTGNNNTGIGLFALNSNTTGINNTAVGREALESNTTGGYNICVGTQSGDAITTGSNHVIIGYNSDPSSATGGGEIVIGNSTVGKGGGTFMTSANNGSFQANNNAHWSTTSDQRIKKNIVDNTTGLNKINQIKVRNFEYKTEDEIKTDNPELTDVVKSAVVNNTGVQVGSIAQEIELVLPDVVRTNEHGIKSVDTGNITWYMINAIKELSAKVTALEAG